jgi:hypothetical protein
MLNQCRQRRFRVSRGFYSVLWLIIFLILFLTGGSGTVARAQANKPRIAIFSGPDATIQDTEALVTSNKARRKYGLPLITNLDGSPVRFDVVRPQRLAAPVTVYIEAFSAHPLESDSAELYEPPDGYVNRQTRAFSKQRQ